ncbi:hypothetical protein MMC11_000482 [Xylographa trunciseda]|nr:hypothetical protein [Xylographa trunciseda]
MSVMEETTPTTTDGGLLLSSSDSAPLGALPTTVFGSSIDGDIISLVIEPSTTFFTYVPNPTFTPPVAPQSTSGTFITSTTASAHATVAPASAATSSAAAVSASTNNGLNGAKIAAILVPVLVVLGLIPIIYLFYLNRRNKRRRQMGTPELRMPPTETQLLQSNSRHNSISLPSPFTDKERWQSGSLSVLERPDSEIQRAPSPTLPSPSLPVFRTQEAWPLTAPLPEPPLTYASERHSPNHSPNHSHNITLRAPTPNVSASIPQPRPAALTEANISSHDLEVPIKNVRESDVVSEMSFRQSTSRRRSERDADEVSFVSALSPDDHSERRLHQLF